MTIIHPFKTLKHTLHKNNMYIMVPNRVRSKKKWAFQAAFGEDSGEVGLIIEFKNIVNNTSVFCLYPNTTEDDYFDLLNAPSAGKWVWANVYHSKYNII